MSETWTSRIRDVSLSPLVLLTIEGRSVDSSLDEIAMNCPLGFFFKDSSEDAFNDLAIVHDMYQAAECTTFKHFDSTKEAKVAHEIAALPFTVALGYLRVELGDGVGGSYTKSVPLMFSSTSEYEEDEVEHHMARTRGLFASGFHNIMSVLLGGDPESNRATTRHESLHMLIAMLPELNQMMYGEDKVQQKEEIAVHCATDFHKQLSTIDKLDFVMTDHRRDYTIGSGKGSRNVKGVYTLHAISDIKIGDKSLISKKLTVSANDPKLQNYLKLKKKEYDL